MLKKEFEVNVFMVKNILSFNAALLLLAVRRDPIFQVVAPNANLVLPEQAALG